MSVLMSTDAGVNEGSPLPDSAVISEAKAGSARLLALADRGNEQHATTTFVYQGPFHEIYTTQAGIDIPLDAFLEFLKPLDISDSPEGIQAVPKRGVDATVALHLGGTMVPDVAVVSSYFTPQALSDLPAHLGQQAPGGELWRTDDPVGVLIANDSVATQLEPIKDRNDPAFVLLAQALRITRTAA